jgi:23S rRNA maturation-related 3'-5' exoribonuclease YhaM
MPMLKTKLKIRKMNTFINRDREIEPMSENDKYILETIERIKNENIPRITRGSLRPQYT